MNNTRVHELEDRKSHFERLLDVGKNLKAKISKKQLDKEKYELKDCPFAPITNHKKVFKEK